MRPRCTCVQCTLLDVPVLGPRNCSLQLYSALNYFYLFDSQQIPGSGLSRMWFLWTGEDYLWVVDMLMGLISCLTGWRHNIRLIQMNNVILDRELLYQQVCWCYWDSIQSLVSVFFSWEHSDSYICQVPAMLFTKNKLMPPKKEECISAKSDTK